MSILHCKRAMPGDNINYSHDTAISLLCILPQITVDIPRGLPINQKKYTTVNMRKLIPSVMTYILVKQLLVLPFHTSWL